MLGASGGRACPADQARNDQRQLHAPLAKPLRGRQAVLEVALARQIGKLVEEACKLLAKAAIDFHCGGADLEPLTATVMVLLFAASDHCGVLPYAVVGSARVTN